MSVNWNNFSIKDLSSFQQRVMSACFIVPAFILAIYWGGVIFFALMALMLAVSFDEWAKMGENSPTRARDATIGSAYLAVGLGTFFLLRVLPDHAAFVTLTLMFIIWASDTGAFFSGKLIGGKKLCPSISPGKTWAGFIGGVSFGGLVAVAAFYVFGILGGPITAFIVGIITAIAGQIGDLVISKYKRYVGVKDTGKIIPGHGGILDRIDSLLLAAPIYLLCIIFLNNWSL